MNNRFELSKTDWFHFIPSGLYMIYSLIIFITDKVILEKFYFYADGRDKDLATWYQVLGLISMTIYLIGSLINYQNYKAFVFNNVSYAETILFKWIRTFMIAFLGILVLRVLFFILNPEWGEFGSQFWHYIAFSLVIFYISLNGYANAVKMDFMNDVSADSITFDSLEEEEEKQGSGSSVEKDIELWKEKTLQLIHGKRIYQNPKLKLSDVAQLLDTNTKTISTVINYGFKMNFNDFINHYRIEAIKKKLDTGEQNTTTLLGIAFDCGFNSKATFNRAFKKSTSLSPKDYLKKIS
ncbi:AraC family transcriptional regulator [Spongiivirga sp. MCCC 1A20706]|uniref:helix-turn-helix domain-containing protein n=1 Tax=Spongiivirga sp. MCCC 1A20706 TaxID=3160963 RepID=UPI0039775F83